MLTPPNEVLARETRRLVEDLHTEWDAPHQFVTLHWDGERISYGTVACILTDIQPRQYPQLMAEFVREQTRRRDLPPMCACALQIEAFTAAGPGPDATPAEQAQFQRDRENHTFHERPDATESAVAWCADTYGFLWSAAKTRANPTAIKECYYRPGEHLRPGGLLVGGLLTAARLPVVASN